MPWSAILSLANMVTAEKNLAIYLSWFNFAALKSPKRMIFQQQNHEIHQIDTNGRLVVGRT